MQTLNQFAWQLGAHDRVTLEHSLQWHKAYVRADKATQAAWRDDFIANYVAGRLSKPATEKTQAVVVTVAQAKKICALTRVERTEPQEKAVNAASKKFAYHIVRKTPQRKEVARVRIAQSERKAWESFVAAVGADRAAIIAKTLG